MNISQIEKMQKKMEILSTDYESHYAVNASNIYRNLAFVLFLILYFFSYSSFPDIFYLKFYITVNNNLEILLSLERTGRIYNIKIVLRQAFKNR